VKIYYSNFANVFLKENRYDFCDSAGLLYLYNNDYSREDFIRETNTFFNLFSTIYIVIIDDDKYLFQTNQTLKNYKRSLGKSDLLTLRKNVVFKRDFKIDDVNYYLDVIEIKEGLTQQLLDNIFCAIFNKKNIYIELSDCADTDPSEFQIKNLNGFLTVNKKRNVFRVLFAENLSGKMSVVVFGSKEDIKNLVSKKIGEKEIIKENISNGLHFDTLCLLPMPCKDTLF